MFRPRIIPILLLKGNGLVKTVKFAESTYIGDPINAVKIFNDLEADELVFLDISATNEHRVISKTLVKLIGDEAFMPFSVGGGITQVEQIRDLLALGAEKVVLNSTLYSDSKLLRRATEIFGSQSIIASIDVKKGVLGKYYPYSNAGKKKARVDLFNHVREVAASGAGEIMITSIDRDGTFSGYDLELVKKIADMVSVPVIASGGAGSLADMRRAYFDGNASACAAGSLFVYHGPRKGILINYPEKAEIVSTFKNVD